MKQKDVSLGNSISFSYEWEVTKLLYYLKKPEGFFKKNPSAKRDMIIF